MNGLRCGEIEILNQVGDGALIGDGVDFLGIERTDAPRPRASWACCAAEPILRAEATSRVPNQWTVRKINELGTKAPKLESR